MWYVLVGILAGAIILILAWSGLKTNYSAWQLKQKQTQTKSLKARRDLERLQSKTSLLSWQVMLLIVLFVLLVFSLKQILQDFWLAFGYALVALLFMNLLAKWRVIKNLAQNFYLHLEKHLLKIWRFFGKFNALLQLNSLKGDALTPNAHLNSIEELYFLLDNSTNLIGDAERRAMRAALEFNNIQASEIMTSLTQVVSVGADDLIGPLALDELHRTGEEFFAVLNKNDKFVGLLCLSELTSLDDKMSKTAQELCLKNLSKIKTDDSLRSALNQFLIEQTKVALVSEKQKTLGILRLSDVIATLLGDKL